MKAGGEVHRFMPSLLYSILRANYRNHRKIAVIDGRIGYTGGINIATTIWASTRSGRPGGIPIFG